MEKSNNITKPPFWPAVIRALSGKCPNCGKGRLFKSYLKQVDNCAVCNEPFGHIRADDGPAWLTILIVGHLLVPIAILVFFNTDWPTWVHMIIWPILTLISALLVLPHSKGFFLAMIWRTGCEGSRE